MYTNTDFYIFICLVFSIIASFICLVYKAIKLRSQLLELKYLANKNPVVVSSLVKNALQNINIFHIIECIYVLLVMSLLYFY